MSFLRVEIKKSGTYLRIVQSYKDKGISKHKTLYSMGKLEDYPPDQLERIAKKLLELSGCILEDIVGKGIKEISRLNYGYALVIKKLWRELSLDQWMRKVNQKRKVRFDWLSTLELMISERINEASSKLATFNNQNEYIGFSKNRIDLQHFYRTLDILADEQESLKKHLFTTQQSLFSTQLDVVFYDVTTLYFDSQKEDENSIRQKGYSKDGKAHKNQIVLGLLVDKLRNPITYHIYKGNTYEGKTMIDALEDVSKKYNIDKVIAVADSAMIDKNNRDYMESSKHIDYIIGDRIKNLPREITEKLVDKSTHNILSNKNNLFTYTEQEHQGRRIICTYSEKRARKDRFEREKLIRKAEKLLETPSQLKQSKKRGAGRFIKEESKESYALDVEKIRQDERWDGFKAVSTTTNLTASEIIEKYSDLIEVEQSFRTLKSQLKIRPIYHWTNKRIEGHIAMCFMSYTMLNYLRLSTGLQNREIVKAIDMMQVSHIQEEGKEQTLYLRSRIDDNQKKLIQKLKLMVPNDTTPQNAINHYFVK